MTNEELKRIMKSNGVRQWQIAENLGMNEASFSKLFRHELSVENKDRILKAISEICDKKEKE